MRTATTALAALMISLLLAVPSAHASASAIYQACANGTSLSGFSKSDLQAALGSVPADKDEYFSCSAQIRAALIDKATGNLPGGHGVKGTKERLRNADINDLTTPAERRRARARVARETQLHGADPLAPGTAPSVRLADGHTLASSAAPGSPTLLVIGVIALLVLLGADLASRFANLRRIEPGATESNQRDDDS